MENTADVFAHLPPDSVLRSLSAAELRDFLKFSVKRRLDRNETLITAGDPGDSMMIVLAGTLKVCVRPSPGREVVLDYLGPGGVIGEIAVLDGKPRTADVVACEPAEVVVLQRRFVIPFLERNPATALRVIELLCAKIRRTNSIIRDSGAAMGPKLARGILRLLEEHGVHQGDTVTIAFRLSQTELGNYVSLSRENVNRQLREWECAGLVKTARGHFSVTDLPALTQIADGDL